MWSLFIIFFSLGWVSFGGPAAHLGYFRKTFVEKHQWLSEEDYAQLIALSQFLPGPGSSQVGFAIGYQRHSILGGLLAFIGFTLPAVLIMIAVALLSHQFLQTSLWISLTSAFKLLAVVVVSDAILAMSKQFCNTWLTRSLALITAGICFYLPTTSMQITSLCVCALVMFFVNKNKLPADPELAPAHENTKLSFTLGSKIALLLFLACWLLVLFASTQSISLQIFSQFYQAGSLVFGGGHVVLPLLQASIGDGLSQEQFLAGYSAAQAIPGPMFTLATYLGYLLSPNAPVAGALLATLGIFLPGFLLVIICLNHWQSIARKPLFKNMILGVNAAVVGLLLATLCQPIIPSAVNSVFDVVWIIIGLVLLRYVKLPIIYLVGLFVLLGIGFYLV